MQKIQPEEVIYYQGPKGPTDVLIDIRQDWDVEQELNGGGQ